MKTIQTTQRKATGGHPCESLPGRRPMAGSGLLAATLALLLVVDARAVDASLDVGDWGLDTTSRTLPAVLNTAVDIGSLKFNGSTGSLAIAVNASGTGWSVAKRYVLPMRWNLLGISPSNTWLKVLPAYDTGAYGSNNLDLDVKGVGNTMDVRLRVSGTNGTNPATVNITIESTGVNSITFSNASAVVAAPTQTFGGSVLTQIAGRVGVNVAPSTDAALDIDGGNTKGLRLRPRTIAGKPATGTWSKGTLIVDLNGTLWVCTADGTPGTWKTVGTP